jgi:hypothetical protein
LHENWFYVRPQASDNPAIERGYKIRDTFSGFLDAAFGMNPNSLREALLLFPNRQHLLFSLNRKTTVCLQASPYLLQ